MKKTFKLFTALMLGIYMPSVAQMQNWFVSPTRVDMLATPNLTTFGTTATTAAEVANGMYAKQLVSPGPLNNQQLFYVADGVVYDYNNTQIGTINNVAASEIIIVPFGNNDLITNCSNKYNIFYTTSAGGLCKSVLDMNAYSLTSEIMDVSAGSSEFGAIAVSKKNAANERYLYYLSSSGYISSYGGTIKKWIIQNDGSVVLPTAPSNPVLFSATTCPIAYGDAEIFARELDLSPDGQWLAWGSFYKSNTSPRFHLIHLDAHGDFDMAGMGCNAYQSFSIPNAIVDANLDGFRGVEFYQDGSTTRLFMGAGSDGIWYFESPLIPIPTTFHQVVGSFPVFGFSQIELSYNGNMYASSPFVSAAATNIGAFDPGALIPTMSLGGGSPSFTIGNPVPFQDAPKVTYSLAPPGSDLYTLPDQIDGEDYSGITSSPIPIVATVNSFTYPTSSPILSPWSTSNNPWNTTGTVQVIKELRITGNSDLKIDGMIFKFSPNAKVVIEQGGSLTLDGTVFTSDYLAHPCTIPYTWKGVEVLGNTTQSQLTSGAQGKLTLLNASRIEYAEIGAQNLNSGGIIIASSNSSFVNNKIGVKFNKYQNYIPAPSGKKPYYPNLSSFTGCTFSADGLYPFTDPPALVSFNECNGVTFNQCTFHAANSPNLVNALSIGIKSIDSRFTVMDNSSFTNLWHGIDAVRSGADQPFWVFETTFENNQTGIAAKGITRLKVQKNNIFSIGGNLNTAYPVNSGISLDNCTGYIIEENQFNGSGSNVKYGIMIYNSGADYNEIYKNTFTGLDVANVAGGINRDNSAPSIYGLQYVCNQNSGNSMFDFFIGKQVGTFPYGIREYQGMQGFAAGNTFSFTGPATTDIYNKASFMRYYYWNGSAADEPLYFNTPAVTITSVTQQNTCPSNIGGTAQRLTLEEKDSLINSYNIAETAYLNLLYSYNQLMDGGNTNALLNQI